MPRNTDELAIRCMADGDNNNIVSAYKQFSLIRACMPREINTMKNNGITPRCGVDDAARSMPPIVFTSYQIKHVADDDSRDTH